MRVLHLTTEFPPVIYGGLGTAVGGWVTASAREGMTMGVLLVEGELVIDDPTGPLRYGAGRPADPTHRSAREVEGGEPAVVDRLGIRFFQTSWPDAVAAGVRLANRWRPDIVHLHTAMVWPVAEAIQRHTSIPLVYHVHSVDKAEYEIGEEPHPWLAHSQAQEAAIASADRLIALSRDERDLLAGYYPEVSHRIRVVGNGIDESAADGHEVASEHSPEAPLVLYSGRLVERKGIRELLAAIPRVLKAASATRFVLAGGPPPLSGPEVAAQWLTPELAPHHTQIHFTGWLSPSELTTWYRSADVLVVPSRYEPFGMVILEGMLHGLPIVASNVGGPAEILEQGRTGLLFAPRNVEELADSVITLVCDASLRRRIGRAGAEQVRQSWMWPTRVATMREVYEELIPADTPPSYDDPVLRKLSNEVELINGDTASPALALAGSAR
ncbi:MAG: glycosyltransferase family 4 protein [Pseudonocardiaceae bacterium]